METINHAQRDGVATTSTVQPVPAISTQPESSSRQHLSEEEAAVTLQKHWRGYQTRHAATKMSTSDRWDDLKRAAEDKQYAEDQLDNRNDVKSRWHRAAQAAARMEHGDGLRAAPVPASHVRPRVVLDEETRKARRATFWGTLSKGVGKERDENEILPYQSKSLEQQHWLEMIDGKHRYGSNMKYYFRAWKESDTEDNFFRWLDRGEGKNLDLEELPRERLERERILYLSGEQRLNYLVYVDDNGLLRWDRNDELVDTARNRWKDAGHGKGIIPNDDRKTGFTPGDESDSSSLTSDSSASYSAGSDLHENEDTHYVGLDKPNGNNWFSRQKNKLGPKGIKKKLLRKTIRRNTWIYVSDLNMNFFVGIKKSGEFQHSSFLGGGKVTSAGIIVVKEGLIKSLNPLSGHYRSSIAHFRSFVAQMEDKGADLSHVKIAKSVMTLWGLGKYGSATKKEKNLVTKFKSAVGLSHEQTEEEKSQELKENAEAEEREHQDRIRAIRYAEEDAETDEDRARVRREILYGRKKEKEQKKEDTAAALRTA